jgi:hypothetical protein
MRSPSRPPSLDHLITIPIFVKRHIRVRHVLMGNDATEHVPLCNRLSWQDVVKIAVLCVATPCSPNRALLFGGIYRLHLQGGRVSQARNQQKLVTCFRSFLSWLTLWPRRWRWYVPPKRPSLADPHGVTTQKTVIFTVTAERTSNPLQGIVSFLS